MKFKTEDFGNKKEILKYGDHFVSVPVMVDATGIIANAEGKKIIPAGTIVGGKMKPVLMNRQEPVVEKNTADAEGILLWDVDVTYGNGQGSMLIHGYIDLTKITKAPTPEAITALKMITFMK